LLLVLYVTACSWCDVDIGEGAACSLACCKFEPLNDGGSGDVGLLAQSFGQISGLAGH
jgi:hypothetical protein